MGVYVSENCNLKFESSLPRKQVKIKDYHRVIRSVLESFMLSVRGVYGKITYLSAAFITSLREATLRINDEIIPL